MYRSMSPAMSRLIADAVQESTIMDRMELTGWLEKTSNEPELSKVSEIPQELRDLFEITGNERDYE